MPFFELTSKNTDASMASARKLKMIVIVNPIGMADGCRCD
jgi:hypothetical protein